MSSIDPKQLAKQFGKVAVLLGGNSAEREVSLNSGRLVLQGLRDAGVDAHPFDPAERPLSALKDEGFVRAFNALHGGYGENGQIQGALDFYGIRYTGSGVLGSALGLDKFRTKLVWQQLGVPTPPFEAVLRGDDYAARATDIVTKLGLPLFVKPASEGSSVAVIKVKSADALPAALEEAAKFDRIVVVEKSIEGGGEYTACIAGDLDLPVIKIVPAGEFYDYHAK
ncbi:MAG: D-alanine--D-alanine ligase, partial [Paraburkholderia sp.]|nr:D-alanine--D-alanine ligase [Paraburkholderia sp.]